MVKRIILLALLLQFLIPTDQVVAQTPMTFSKMVINIWPEYDRPGVLIFYQITLAPLTTLPATLTIRIPQSAGKPFNVAMKDIDGRLDNLSSTSVTDGEWVNVTFTTPVPEVQFEFYDSAISTASSLHKYEYTWPGDFEIRDVEVVIQQPLAANNFNILPASGSGRTNEDGFTYFEQTIGELSIGTPFKLTISYNKIGTDLSAPSQSVSPIEPVTTNSPGWQTLTEVLPYLLGGLGILLIFVSGYWYWRSGKTLTLAFIRRQSTSPSKELDTEPLLIYCHRCGRKAVNSDVFCRSCGTKLRNE